MLPSAILENTLSGAALDVAALRNSPGRANWYNLVYEKQKTLGQSPYFWFRQKGNAPILNSNSVDFALQFLFYF